jgi:hypothetical protein
MATIEETTRLVVEARTWDERISRIRQIPERHGTAEQPAIYAAIARQLYVSHLGPDFAYVHRAAFYELPHFQLAYDRAASATAGFTRVSAADLEQALVAEPMALLPLRVITGLSRNEFAASTKLVAEALGLPALTASKLDSTEQRGTALKPAQARVAAETLTQIMAGTLFAEPEGDLKSKQNKPDTAAGWSSVQQYAASGVPFAVFLHQRHYGGAFRQVLDATSERRGNLIEDAVAALFTTARVPFIRTGAHEQSEIVRRFQLTVTPAPDFVVFDERDTLRAMIECKGANDGGTARDKAARFRGLRAESVRLGGVPLISVLAGLGWTRVNDTLGPVVRDCDGRVFSVSNLGDMLTTQPFPSLVGTAS